MNNISIEIKKESKKLKSDIYEYYLAKKLTTDLNNKDLNTHLDEVLLSLAKDLKFNTRYIPKSQPVCQHLEKSLKNAHHSFKNICKTSLLIKDHLNWQLNDNYKELFPKYFFNKKSYVELIGLSGLLLNNKIRIGLLLLGDQVNYPPHHHPASELYNIISGKGFWQKGKKDFIELQPGQEIFHKPWEAHAMKTSQEPILALFSWSKDITTEAIPLIT